eukprot:GFKZ01003658.1.p1 GENE.GFKZ01003658.1~~GFKZ01003658.1.p1  ORF type:complete len:622 (-),score=98.36 GFKZ01003658.1:578-2443(-)
MSAADRISAVRQHMAEHNLDGYVIPSEDAHMSEYVSSCDERRAFITGFTGSAGTAVVTMTEALCWTDSRYFLQAKLQLDAEVFKMMRMHEDVGVEEWLAENIKQGGRVGIDGLTVSVQGMKKLKAALAEADRGVSVVVLGAEVGNLVDKVWGSARPAPPASRVFVQEEDFAGATVDEKLEIVRQRMAEKGATMLVVTGLDEVAWLLNLRGGDVDYNPVFWGYVTVSMKDAVLFVNETRFDDGVDEHLAESGVRVRGYRDLLDDLGKTKWSTEDKVWVDPNTCNYGIVDVIEKAVPVVQTLKKPGPIPLAKARKNEIELDGVRRSHVRDGVALVQFLCWLEKQVVTLGREVSEVEASNKVDELRSEMDLFVSLSFPTISGCDSNGAIVHYRAEAEKCKKISKDSMYLVDSGAQYRDGTTDVTRTVHMGEPTEWQKECFTRVLQGHIAIDTAVFPKGTTGHVLDGFARMALWKLGLDYKHGTGHGVGSFLNVHEGPHVISFKAQALGTALEPGFLTSNEPGYYEEGAFGIRIENVCVVTRANVKGPPGGPDKDYYKMEHVTLAPIQRKLIKVGLLTDDERRWVNEYHQEVFDKLAPMLSEDMETMVWLRDNTQPLPIGRGGIM